jgi:hypothetical protein
LHTLKDKSDFGTRGLSDCFELAGVIETTQQNILDWLQLDEGDPGHQLLVFL